jgi:hypothetical protein
LLQDALELSQRCFVSIVHRRNAKLEQLGDLAECEVAPDAEDDHFAVFRREPLKGLLGGF